MNRMISTPTSGAKVMVDRSASRTSAHSPEHHEGDERRDADQHDEGIVVEVAGLQTHDPAGHVERAGGNAVRTEAIDDRDVTLLPEEAGRATWPNARTGRRRARRSTTCSKGTVEPGIAGRHLRGALRLPDVEDVGEDEPERHRDGRRPHDQRRHLVRLDAGCGSPGRRRAPCARRSRSCRPGRTGRTRYRRAGLRPTG